MCNIKAVFAFDLSAVSVCDQVTTVEAVGAGVEDAGGVDAGDLNLPDPVAGSGASGAFELGGHVVGLDNDSVVDMRNAGMTWVKKTSTFQPW